MYSGDHAAIRETIVEGPPRAAFDLFAPQLSSLTEKDDADLQTKLQIIKDFDDLKDEWNCEMFPSKWFPLDLYARQRGRHWTCLEAKHAKNCDLNTMASGPCEGAFIPFTKIKSLMGGFTCGFDYAALVYRIAEIRYYIPVQRLIALQKKEHPKRDLDLLLKEGDMSLPIDELVKWEGLESFIKYIRNRKF